MAGAVKPPPPPEVGAHIQIAMIVALNGWDAYPLHAWILAPMNAGMDFCLVRASAPQGGIPPPTPPRPRLKLV